MFDLNEAAGARLFRPLQIPGVVDDSLSDHRLFNMQNQSVLKEQIFCMAADRLASENVEEIVYQFGCGERLRNAAHEIYRIHVKSKGV